MSRRLAVAIVLLLVASAWNLLFTYATPKGGWPYRSHESDSLRVILVDEQVSLGPSYELLVALREWGGDRVLVAPPGVFLGFHVDGLADMSLAVEQTPVLDDASIAVLTAQAVDTGVLQIEGEDDPRRFFIVEPASSDTRLVLLLAEGVAVVVGDQTLAEVSANG